MYPRSRCFSKGLKGNTRRRTPFNEYPCNECLLYNGAGCKIDETGAHTLRTPFRSKGRATMSSLGARLSPEDFGVTMAPPGIEVRKHAKDRLTQQMRLFSFLCLFRIRE